MDNTPPSVSAPQPVRKNRDWLTVLGSGLLLFIITTIVLLTTGNPNLFPTVIIIGNFLIPVVFVTFLYDHQHISGLDTVTISKSFILGGVLGVLGASILETLLLPITSPDQGLTLSNALLVGLIEEGCKLLAVMFIARKWQHTSTMNGLLLGAAVGMGFAALESTGYAFTALLLANGQALASIVSTVLRGLLAPFGHGVWTAIASAVLFSQSRSHHFRISMPVILTYLFVSLLHGFWDGLPRTIFLVVGPDIHISIVSLGLSIVGVVILYTSYKQANKERNVDLSQP